MEPVREDYTPRQLIEYRYLNWGKRVRVYYVHPGKSPVAGKLFTLSKNIKKSPIWGIVHPTKFMYILYT